MLAKIISALALTLLLTGRRPSLHSAAAEKFTTTRIAVCGGAAQHLCGS